VVPDSVLVVFSDGLVCAGWVALRDDAPSQDFEVRSLSATVGAEVLGLDLSQPLKPTDFASIHRAHLEHHVLVFRDKRITLQQQVDFSRIVGLLLVHVLKSFQLAGYPEIMVLSNINENGVPIGLVDAGVYWHSDPTCFWPAPSWPRLRPSWATSPRWPSTTKPWAS
jgi:alpha-ketoglutarate-dependent taurine dioxygenase